MNGTTSRGTLDAGFRTLSDLAWSPCGRHLAAPHDGAVAVWSFAQGSPERGLPRRVATLTGLARNPSCVSWSPDGSALVVGTDDGEVVRWRPDGDGRAQLRPAYPKDAEVAGAFCVAWSPGGNLIAVGGGDAAITIWHAASGKRRRRIASENTARYVTAVAWSPDGRLLARASQTAAVSVFEGRTERWSYEARGYARRLSWSPDGTQLAASHTKQVLVFDAESGRLRDTLEGSVGDVYGIGYSADGRALASVDTGGTLRFWDTRTWSASPAMEVATVSGGFTANTIAFHPQLPLLAVATRGGIELLDLDWDAIFSAAETARTVRITSAKVVLVGESEAGKSCLAMRLAEDRYPTDAEQGTTHGLQFWRAEAERLHPSVKSPDGHRRDVFLWDFGGQREYRLVHQLFLDDATVALVVFDPTRGTKALDDVRSWDKHLERHMRAGRDVKLLVGSKQDVASELVDRAAIDALVAEHGFRAYVEVSAKTGRNIAELRERLADALDWDALATTSRPELFQLVREYVEERQNAGEVVLLVADLVRALKASRPDLFDAGAIASAAGQLAVQGLIARTTLTGGDDALVLQVPAIERYAGSLIVAARSNPRGVPALEERLLGSESLPLPGIAPEERLRRIDERVVLECVAELMIQHGLCFRHENLLVFPSLFPRAVDDSETLPHSVSLYYDFTGAIDNVYASLVARLVMSEAFGVGRLYPGRVEFDEPDEGLCGVRNIVRKGGLAHLDLYFSESATPDRRALFAEFVSDHLAAHGIVIREYQTVRCSNRRCGREIAEDIVEAQVSEGHSDVMCPWCRTLTLISQAVAEPETSPAAGLVVALRSDVEQRTRHDSRKAKAAVAKAPGNEDGPIRLLHLSDLHFTGQTVPEARANALIQDLRRDLKCDTVEYLVISGDITDRGNDAGFEMGRRFARILIRELGISAERCVFVPGNHDVQDLDAAHRYCGSRETAKQVEPDETLWQTMGDVFLVPDPERYPDRLKAFSEAFFHKVLQREYRLDYAEQGVPYLFEDTRIQFLTLNSCWQIDRFNRKRAGVHPAAVARVITMADRQLADAREQRKLGGSPVLRIGVWHHALQHPEMMRNVAFVGQLQKAGVRLALHGDVHELNRERFKYWRDDAMHIAGAGSFGSPPDGRPDGTPRLYNLLVIDRDLAKVRVHTRRQMQPDGPWDGWNEWPPPGGGEGGVPYYDLEVNAV